MDIKYRILLFSLAALACVIVPVKDVFPYVPEPKLIPMLIICSFRKGASFLECLYLLGVELCCLDNDLTNGKDLCYPFYSTQMSLYLLLNTGSEPAFMF